jgi:DNA polymerase III gamma/tau subunit
MITDSEMNIKRATHQRYLLEAVLLRMATAERFSRVSDVIAMLKGGQIPNAKAPPARPKTKAGKKSSRPKSEPEPPRAAPAKKKPPAARKDKPRESAEEKESGGAGGHAVIVQRWSEVIEGLRESKASLASVLDLCDPPDLADGVYWLQLPTRFHESQVLKGQNLRILTQELAKLTNSSVVVRTRVREPAEQAPKVEREDAERTESKPRNFDSVLDKDPVVKKLIENIGGKIVDVRDARKESGEDKKES